MIYNEDEKNTTQHVDYECCYCKKIFMGLVILILTFMAGIMVGNCGRCHYSDNYYQNHYHHKKNKPQKNKPQKTKGEVKSWQTTKSSLFLL